ncbi:MAG: M23 family metallopeptidase [Betaproteobacteria bacterium]|nr:M23 family metallopeptidase [Betaproteobacteria bacterium]
MNIILVSNRLSKPKTLTVTVRQMVLVTAVLACAGAALCAAIYYFVLRFAVEGRDPLLEQMVREVQADESLKAQSYVRAGLSSMAAKLGELQAQVLRLNTLGERLTKAAGMKPQEFQLDRPPGQGGAEVRELSQPLSTKDLEQHINKLASALELQADRMGVLESTYTHTRAQKRFEPSAMPVDGGYHSSNFGWRIDPVTGNNAFHEGIDFVAKEGTPIKAAAAGVVIFADAHPHYGMIVEIDHGNDLITRYAHASRILVKTGEVVIRGSVIAEVGSTGRSTGPHLHFEVRQRGLALNPLRYLKIPS